MTAILLLYLWATALQAKQQANNFHFDQRHLEREHPPHHHQMQQTMRDLYHFALARKHSLMTRVGLESEDPRCRKSRVRTDYEYDLSTPSSQSLATRDLQHEAHPTDTTASHEPDISQPSPYQPGVNIPASSPDSCLLLDPPTTRERFERIEAAIDEVAPLKRGHIRIPGSKSELHPNILLGPPSTRERYNRIESAITDVLNQSTHQLDRQPSPEDLGGGAIVRGRENQKRSASTGTILKRHQPAVLKSTGDGGDIRGPTEASSPKSSRFRPKPQPRSATTNESRHFSRDLLDLFANDHPPNHAPTRPKRPLPRSPAAPADSHSSRDPASLFATEPPVTGSVSSFKPNIVYRLPPVLLDHEDDIFRSSAALEHLLDEAKRSVERRIYQESQIPPRREESAIHSPRPQRAFRRRPVSFDDDRAHEDVAGTARKVSR